jgi:Ca2+-binding RTX toxin-like protein
MPTVTGTPGDDTLIGTDDSDDIHGGAGNDVIQGGAGHDFLYGDDGDDIIYGGDGDRILGLPDFIRDGPGNDIVYGGADEDYILASPGDDFYDGGTGVVYGFADRDTVDYGSALTGISVDLTRTDFNVWSRDGGDASGIGHDRLVNVEGIIGSAFADIMTGDASNNGFSGSGGNDLLYGADGDDILSGGAGDDLLDGGAGEDIAAFDYDAGVTVSLEIVGGQDTGQGIDTLVDIEDLRGGQFTDVLTGDAGDNYIDGGLGGDDRLFGRAGVDHLFGSPFGTNYLDGGTGADVMVGGSGSDTFIVDNIGDRVYDEGDYGSPGDGTDVVRASITYTLGYDIENLVMTGSAAINGSGNSGANAITGNAGANILYGYAGNDLLDGGAGGDKMIGGSGDDAYIVSDATDYAYENAGEGTDSVIASVSYTLRANVENLTLIGTANLTGKGNDIADTITGNSGANALYGYAGDDMLLGGGGRDILDGGTGTDTLQGGADNDIYVIDSTSDVIVETADGGVDFVQSSASYTLSANVERMYLLGSANIDGTGNDLANLLVGNSGANMLSGLGANDRIYGGDGNDQINGGDGNDYMEGGAGQDDFIGGAGKDYFVFRDGDFADASTATADRIQDFTYGDRISVSPVDANSGIDGNQAFAFIGTASFDGTAGELRYEQTGGNTYLSGDTDGDGIADFWILLDGLHTMTAGDFIL